MMDTTWISLSRVSNEYKKGLEEFLDDRFSDECLNNQILCPCIKCGNEIWVNRAEARMHLICDGFIKGYRITPSTSQPSTGHIFDTIDDMQGLVRDAYNILDENILANEVNTNDENINMPNDDANKFFKLLEDARKELYPGCKKFSVLSFIVRLFHSKCVGKCNDHGFGMMLDILREAFPDALIPKSLYEMKKTIKSLGLSYEKIDACPNDCMLYLKGSTKSKCDICHTSRYKQSENNPNGHSTTPTNRKKIAAKVLRYFPIKPRLQRLFMSSKTAASMRWHEESRTKDGCLRHPADSPAWQTYGPKKKGIPVDKKTTSQLTHFMGSLARSGKYCPLHKPWNKVSGEKKETLLDFLKEKFDLPPESDEWLLKSFGKKVRNWRARVKKDCFDPSLSYRKQISSKPKQVHAIQWKKLVKSWRKEKSMNVSEKNKENRAKKKMVQVTGKKSYARVREELKASSSGVEPSPMALFHACYFKDGIPKNVEAGNAIDQMQELSSQLPDGSVDVPGPNDVFSKVMGEDQNGLASMYGLGVRACDVWGVTPSRSTYRRENLHLKSKCEQLSDKVDNLTSMVLQMQGSNDNASNVSTRHPLVPNEPQTLRVGVQVDVRSILNYSEIIAKGWLKSLDPNEEVGGEEIGPNWCEVSVQVPIKRNEHLVRRYGLFVTIGDAIGATIAWPCSFISVVHDEA